MEATISAHHGNKRKENNLRAALQLIEDHPEVDVYEIDFVTHHGLIISAHDYADEAIKNGSLLSAWIDHFIAGHKRTLWLDIKENLSLYFHWCHEKFDESLLYDELERSLLLYPNIDITRYVWIGCQDVDLRQRLWDYNERHCKGKWQMILDMPTAPNYVAQLLLPCLGSWVRDAVCEQVEQELIDTSYRLFSLDQSFFHSMREMKRFLRTLTFPPNSTLVLNSFADRSIRAPHIERVHIVMQYDYYVK
jgi:Fe-S-cluster formation regulator IscX/YfhJ